MLLISSQHLKSGSVTTALMLGTFMRVFVLSISCLAMSWLHPVCEAHTMAQEIATFPSVIVQHSQRAQQSDLNQHSKVISFFPLISINTTR